MYARYSSNNIEPTERTCSTTFEESADNAENKNKSCHGLCFSGSILLLQYLFITQYYNILLLLYYATITRRVRGVLCRFGEGRS